MLRKIIGTVSIPVYQDQSSGILGRIKSNAKIKTAVGKRIAKKTEIIVALGDITKLDNDQLSRQEKIIGTSKQSEKPGNRSTLRLLAKIMAMPS